MEHPIKLVAIFTTHAEAEDAIRQLQDKGFPMKQLSLIGQDYHSEEHPVGYVNIADRAKSGGKFGALWGGLCGILFGSALIVVPGVGHLVILGALASALTNLAGGAALGGAVGAVGALGGALASIGIPHDSVLQYESEVKAGRFLLIAHGEEAQITRAKQLLHALNPDCLDEHLTAPAH
ncbi:DUF1269 domain-containing protein [Herbaspirillum sp. LeCh32-8]|uniref:general stress protein n=1 Tax=Herbaspirillum sp. LeCh32-8 TaxID=2821356 RepID=UPI001AE9913B|nr:general stress protein [Herbaspirillum sp. LeCh32-8]MBP0597627.1 DUF1269 domain-containing protein [Herbaspirillum sp. LeCh32-8]